MVNIFLVDHLNRDTGILKLIKIVNVIEYFWFEKRSLARKNNLYC